MRTDRFGWVIVFLLFAGSTVNYMDRALFAFVMPQIRRSLSLTNTDYSLAVNAFLLLYMVFYVVGGRVADRVGYRRAFLFNVIVWSIASMLHSLTRGITSLCLFRALLGVGEGGFFPTAMQAITQFFAPSNRVKAVALVITGGSVGMLITPLIGAWVTLHFGWRAAFFVTGSIGFLLVPPWLFLHRKSDRSPAGRLFVRPDKSQDVVESKFEEDMSLGKAIFRRQYLFLLTARSITDAVWFFYLFWVPGYFQDIRHFNLANIGTLLWIPFLSADIGCLAGAWASSSLIKQGFGLDPSHKTVMLISALLCLFGPFACYVTLPSVALGLLSIAFFGQFSWGSNLHTVITEITPPRHVAALFGITGAVGTLMAVISQPLIGHLVDSVGYGPAFAAAGLIFTVAIVLLLAAGKIKCFESTCCS